ncbi:MAG TPA: hypothetical protein VGY96_02090, partial [Streptosporangiaceae bacterium]|nr:hypothetical protein [Streptosporangiaceae bacterium]
MAADEPQLAGASERAWPDRIVPSWSVPQGLTAPDRSAGSAQAQASPHSGPPDEESPAEEDAWPGVAPPAGWFLRTPGNASPAEACAQIAVADPATGPGVTSPAATGTAATGPGTDDGDGSLTGEWFAASALEPGQSADHDDSEPAAQPLTEQPAEPASQAPPPDQPSSEPRLLAQPPTERRLPVEPGPDASGPVSDGGAPGLPLP